MMIYLCKKRTPMKNGVTILLFLCLLFGGVSISAKEDKLKGVDVPPFQDWLLLLREEALSKGISAATLDATLLNIKPPMKRVIKFDRNQPEFKLTFQQYLDRVAPPVRVNKGRRMLIKHKKLLAKIEAKYQVQARYIVAFWGMETSFGRLTGGFNALDALATLAYDGRRSAYFRRELFNALKIIDAGHVLPKDMTASWAGAMGQTQFMPSTFLSYAIDFDGDGKTNVWGSTADALASGANYLSSIGWNGDRVWGREVKLPVGMDKSLIDLKVKRKISQWQSLGVRRVTGKDLPIAELEASIVQMDDKTGRAFMIYDNYRAIMQWNRSKNFATAIGILSDRIGAK